MAKTDRQRYFWLKLKDDFFNSDDIKILLSQKNGEKYVIFWQKLLLKAITSKEVGVLKYKDQLPYTPEMLSTILDTDIDTVKSAMDIFVKLGMVGILPDGAFWLQEAEAMVGGETKGAERKRLYRANKGQNPPEIEGADNVPHLSERDRDRTRDREDIETDKDKEDIPHSGITDKDQESLLTPLPYKPKTKNTKEMVYFAEPPKWLAGKWREWGEYRREIRKKITETTARRQLKKLIDAGPGAAEAMIDQSIENGWTGLFPLKEKFRQKEKSVFEGML